MYGVIHASLRDMVLRDFGSEKWDEIILEAQVDDNNFINMKSYPDEITYALINASSKILGAPVETCLELFGEYWITEAAPGTYADILDATGSEIIQFINNINLLHDRITSTFPYYVPPEFHINEEGNGIYIVDYISTRIGLAPFVRGLLKGLAIRFSCDINISSTEQLDVKNGEHWKFTLVITG